MRDLNSLKVFVRVAQFKSFKQAAANLGLTSSAVSKAITRLEAEMGVSLLQRTTRSVGLTEDGMAFFDNCRHILEEIERAENLLSRATLGPHGRLRVHMTVGYGRRIIMPKLHRFLAHYSNLSVSVELSDRVVDIVNEGFDIDIRIGEISDGRVVARKLDEIRFVTCASPSYLATYGTPQTPGDLEKHNCLAYAVMHTGRMREWLFQEAGRVRTQHVSGTLDANNSEALLRAAAAGVGLAQVSQFIARDAIAKGQVMTVLDDYAPPGKPVYAIYPRPHHVAQKVRAFIDFLISKEGS